MYNKLSLLLFTFLIRSTDMNMLEATRFIVLMQTKEQVERSEVKEYLPRRRKIPGKRTGKLGLTTENSTSAVPNDQSQWVWPEKRMTEGARKKIFVLVVEQLVRLFCETQTYM